MTMPERYHDRPARHSGDGVIVESMATLAAITEDQWNRIAPSGNLYQSYRWLRASEIISPSPVRYHCAWQSSTSTLVGCLPAYQYLPGGNPAYDPRNRFVLSNATVDQWYPHQILGARSGYLQQPSIAPELHTNERIQVFRKLIDAAHRSTAEVTSVSIPFLTEQARPLVTACVPEHWSMVAEGANTVLDVPPDGFDGYLRARSNKRRAQIRRERRVFAECGITIQEHRLRDRLAVVAETAVSTQQHHGSTITVKRMTSALEAQAEWLDDASLVLQARHGNDTVGAALFFRHGDDLFLRTIGFDRSNVLTRNAFTYFNLAFYEPIARCAPLGIRRIWLGPGSLDTKIRRGARECSLFSAVLPPPGSGVRGR